MDESDSETVEDVAVDLRFAGPREQALTEADWQGSVDPTRMLWFLQWRADPGKPHRFGIACCLRGMGLTDDPRHRDGFEAARLAADGRIGPDELERRLEPLIGLWPDDSGSARTSFDWMTNAVRHTCNGRNAEYAARFTARALASQAGPEGSDAYRAVYGTEEQTQADILRDIIGRPFRPFEIDPAWLAGVGREAVAIAREIDATERFDRMADLADAIERAGGADPEMIAHLRGPGPHVPGCWAIDALLGRPPAVARGPSTEAEWRALTDPTSLMEFLLDRGTDATWRRFAVACCRRVDGLIKDERSRRAVDVAARHAVGEATDAELDEAHGEAVRAMEDAGRAQWTAEAEENFCFTPRYCGFARDLSVARLVSLATGRDLRVLDPDPEPGWDERHRWERSYAAAVWAVRSHGYALGRGGPDRDGPAESRAQVEILLDLFDEFLGPPGDEGGWLPCGSGQPVAEWYCLFPTRRQPSGAAGP